MIADRPEPEPIPATLYCVECGAAHYLELPRRDAGIAQVWCRDCYEGLPDDVEDDPGEYVLYMPALPPITVGMTVPDHLPEDIP